MLRETDHTHTSHRIANEVRHRSDALNNANHPSAQSRTGGQDDASGSSLFSRKLTLVECQNLPPEGGRNGPERPSWYIPEIA